MGYADQIVADHFQRTGQPRAGAFDGAYQYQVTVLRDLLTRLEVILDDEGVPRDTAKRVIRCMLYGMPSQADAELRMRQTEEMTKLLMEQAPPPIPLTGLGLPPQ